MNKKLSIIAACLMFCGCSNQIPLPEFEVNGFEVVRIDKCQYLMFTPHAHQAFFAHKGNCDNPIHIHNGGNHE